MTDEYMTIAEAAAAWGVSTRRIQTYCTQGCIEGANRFGRIWVLPKNAQKPEDARVTTGAYRNWRKSNRSDEK
ncbi:MAG: DNA-binding protein [Clostridia bacterium]|nr:DNA-binding protein [Clostridia bacterium]